MAAASRSLAPASPQQRAVFEVMMGDFFAVQSMRLGDDIAPAYWAQVWAVIGDLPPDLLRRAAERIASTWRWPTPPRPADYRAAVAEQMAERSAARAKLDTALRFGREADKPGKRDPATIARVAEIVGGMKARPNTTQEPTDADLARLKAQALAQVAATKEDAA